MLKARGVRNNNPGNIEYSPENHWRGQVEPDQDLEVRFARFDTPENGIRALAKLLMNYREKDGIPSFGGPGVDTIFEIFSRWAPSFENDTSAYAEAVARAVGVAPDEVISTSDLETLRTLVTAVILHENGSQPYSFAEIDEGVRRAFL